MAKPVKPDWVKFNLHRAKASPTWGLPDFKWCWYTKLWMNSYDSDRPGYLPYDVAELWKLAGARTKEFFVEKGGMGLVDLHFKRTADGLWIYHPKVLEVLEDFRRNPQKQETPSLFSSDLGVVVDFVDPCEFGKIIERLFAFYREKLGKRADYTLTEKRRKKATARLWECLKSHNGNIGAAEIVMREAIQNLASSDWHRENGHTDWLDHIFNSEEIFQKRLERKPEPRKQTEAEVGKHTPGKVSLLQCYSDICKKRFDPNKEPAALPFCSLICKTQYAATMAKRKAAK